MKILYLIHIDWYWIFQRPQIIELHLEKDFDCTVVNRKFLFSKKSKSNNPLPHKMINIYQIPKEHKFKCIRLINKILFKLCIKNIKNYDYIWITYPLLYDFIPNNYNGKIIYDCMDNYVSMAPSHLKKLIENQEQKLIHRADYVLASSKKLMEIVPGLSKAFLIRNGYVFQESKQIKIANKKKKYIISYFGTISSWFDFELLNKSLNQFDNIEYHLIGPKEKILNLSNINLSSKIIFEGTVEHNNLYEKIKNDDALIMPFKINEIILSVDPVKLYEYICFGKCIISIWYPEIDRFAPFVYFYKSEQEYLALISNLSKNGFPPKYNKQQQNDFLKQNTWDERYNQIKAILNEKR